MILLCLPGKVRMLIVCHISYQASEAIVHMKQIDIIPTEHQYSRNATEPLMIDTCNAKLL